MGYRNKDSDLIFQKYGEFLQEQTQWVSSSDVEHLQRLEKFVQIVQQDNTISDTDKRRIVQKLEDKISTIPRHDKPAEPKPTPSPTPPSQFVNKPDGTMDIRAKVPSSQPAK
jgi:hypothetical protein